MKITSALLLAALTLLPLTTEALAQRAPPGPCVTSVCARGAPGPIMGAGLPVLAAGIGYGIYWIVRRRRRMD